MRTALVLLLACSLIAGSYLLIGQGRGHVASVPAPEAKPAAESEAPVGDPSVVPAGVAQGTTPGVDGRIALDPNVDMSPAEVSVIVRLGFGKLLARLRKTDVGAGLGVAIFDPDRRDVILAQGTTGEDGSVSLKVPRGLLDLDEQGYSALRACVTEPGYVRAEGRVYNNNRDRGTEGKAPVFKAYLKSSKGWSRRVMIDGEIQSGVHDPVTVRNLQRRAVRVAGRISREYALRRDRRSHARRIVGNEYELSFLRSEEDRWVIVDGGQGGRAAWNVEHPEADAGAEEPVRIALQGSARLNGHVVDARGEPAIGVTLYATWVPSTEPGGADATSEPLHSELMKRGEGQFYQASSTGTDGAYAFEGLIPGTFRIDTIRTTERLWQPKVEVLGFQDATADPEPARFEFTRASIVVSVDLGPEDVPCSLVLYDAGESGGIPWAREGWNRQGLPAAGSFASMRDLGPDRPGFEDRTAIMEVRSGRQYFLVVRGEGYDRTPQLVVPPEDGAPARVSVGPPGAGATGTLKVHLTLGELQKPEGAVDWYDEPGEYGVMVLDPDTGMPFASFTSGSLEKGPPSVALPAGQFRVVAVGMPFRDSHHGTVIVRRKYGRVERLVDIEAGAVTEVAMELTQNGGDLEVTLAGEITAADKAFVEKEAARLAKTAGWVSKDDRERILRGTLHLENVERRIYVGVDRTALAMMDSSAGGEHTLNEWPMAETHRSDVLAPGTYTLHATFPGRPAIQKTVTILEGETTPVTLDFGG